MATGRLPDPNTAPVTAKGDLYTYSTVPAKLAVGSNGETLVADSSASVGLSYSSGIGLSQPVINSGFDVWQRGTSVTTSGGYTADRWSQVSGNSIVHTRSTDVPSNSGFTYSMSMAGVGSNIVQRIEALNAARYAGQTITVSLWYKSTVGTDNFNIALYYANSADNFGAVTQIGSTQTIASPSTSWVRVSYTFTNISASAANGLALYVFRGSNATATTLFTGVQVDLGSVALPYRRAGGNIAGELAACYRYFWKTGGEAAFQVLSPAGITESATICYQMFYPSIPMRTAPTLTTTTASNYRVYDGAATYTATALAISGATFQNWNVQTTVASGMTAGRANWLQANNSTNATLSFSAEL